MGNKIHSEITDQIELHNPKGFTEARTDFDRVPVKKTSGSLVWERTSDLIGKEGPPGPSIPTLEVVTIDNPSELNTLDNAISSQYLVVEKSATANGKDLSSLYQYQSGAAGFSESPPVIVDGLDGKWLFVSGDAANVPSFETSSTSVLSGGDLTLNSGNQALFDLSETLVQVVDNYTARLEPTITFTLIASQTGLSVTNIGTQPETYIYLSSSGIIQNSARSSSLARDAAFVGALFHSDGVSISIVANIPSFAKSPSLAIDDFSYSIGAVNIKGNVYGAASNDLTVSKTSGETFIYNGNAVNDIKNPHITTDAVLNGGDILGVAYQNGTGGYVFGNSTSIDPSLYDDGSGTLAAVPATKWTLRRLYFSPNTGLSIVLYGNVIYDNKADALEGVVSASWPIADFITWATHRSTLAVEQSATDLSDTAQATFTSHGKFGGGTLGGGGGQIITLQNAYDNSNGASLETSLSGNPFTIKRGAAASTTALRVKDELDADVFTVSSGGAITGENAVPGTQGLMSGADKTKLDGIEALAEVNPTDTDEVPEGATNFYYTESRWKASMGVDTGWAQYANGVLFNTISATYAPIDLSIDLDSNLNGLFTKPSANLIQVDFTGKIRVYIHAECSSIANTHDFFVILERNSVGVTTTELQGTTPSNPRILNLNRTIILSVTSGDQFGLSGKTSLGDDISVATLRAYVSIERI